MTSAASLCSDKILPRRRNLLSVALLIGCLFDSIYCDCTESTNYCQASSSSSQNKMAADPANYKILRKDLLELYNKFIEAKEDARNFVKAVTDQVLDECRKDNIVKDTFYAGSYYEKLSVGASHDYDIIIYLNHGTKWKVVPHPNDVDFVKLESEGTVNDNSFKVRAKSVVQEQQEYLSAAKARKMLLGYVDQALQKWRNRMTVDGVDFKVTRKQGGPAVTLLVADHSRYDHIEIDLVVGVRLEGGTCYVAKPIDKTKPDAEPKYWRKSFAEDEKRKLDTIDAGNKICRKVLRMVKAIKLYNPQFRAFPSYVYKNVLLEMTDEGLNWSDDQLAHRFVDYITRLLARLQSRKVYIYFNKRSNLLKANYKAPAEQLANYLSRLVKKENLNGFRELVQSANRL